MKFAGMLLVVKDMEVSRRFYREVLRQNVFLDLETYVQFEDFCLITKPQWREFQDRPDQPYLYGNNVCQLAFEEVELDGFLAHFEKFPGIEITCAVKEYPWGQRSFRFYDPDRHVVEVGEDMKAVTKRFLRAGMPFEDTLEKVQYPPEFVQMCADELRAEGK